MALLCSVNIISGQDNPGALNTKAFAPKFYLLAGEELYIDTLRVVTKEKLRVNLVQQDGDTIHIRVNPHQDFTDINPDLSLVSASNSVKDDPYLFIGNGAYAHLKYKDWDTNPLLIPIKIRPSTDDNPLQFVGEVSLGTYIGYETGKLSINEAKTYNYSQTIGLFAAPGMIKIDPSVADTDMSNLTLGFSLGISYIINFNTFQMGLVGGVDYISGDVSKTWIYQGKPWFSFTIGFDFNDEEKN